MNLDSWINFLKIFSILTGSIFGVLALVTKYKDTNDKITKWGKIALGGIIVSFLVSITLQIVETEKAKTSAKQAQADTDATARLLQTILSTAQTTTDQQKRSLDETNKLKLNLEETLKKQQANLEKTDLISKGMQMSISAQRSVLKGNEKISRNLDSAAMALERNSKTTEGILAESGRILSTIQDITVSFRIEAPIGHSQLKSYHERLEKQIRAILSTSLKPDRHGYVKIDDKTSFSFGYDEIVDSVVFREGSPLFANNVDEALASDVLRSITIKFEFYRTPIYPNMTETERPDLSLFLIASSKNIEQNKGHSFSLQYGIKSQRLILNSHQVKIAFQSSRGKIISINDLVGAQLVISIYNDDIISDQSTDKHRRDIRRAFEPLILIIDLAPGRRIFLAAPNLKRFVDNDGNPIFVYNFPNSLEELNRLF